MGIRVTNVSALPESMQGQARRKLTDRPAFASFADQTGTKAPNARGVHTPGRMNRTEQAYADHLAMRMQKGEVAWFAFEGLRFRLADRTYYNPDFVVMLASGELEAHEVKGHWEDDARVKIKVAAETYPLRFIAVQKKEGTWAFETIGGGGEN